MAQPEWLPVMDLLVRDESNPRSLLFQAIGIRDYLLKIEHLHGPCGSGLLDDGIALLFDLDVDTEFRPESVRLQRALALLQDACQTLHARLNKQFFTHPQLTVKVDRNLGGLA
jgi:uncharacterized alpha-E superfamily protein